MQIPSDEEIRALHSRHAPTDAALDLVYTHCQAVCAIAEQLMSRPTPAVAGIDVDLVRAGCLLHDIGVYQLYDQDGVLDPAGYVRHGVLGHDLLAQEGLPERICRFASHHTGVGITRQDVLTQGLPLPEADYMAETVEETVVMYADKFHTKSSPARLIGPQDFAASIRRFGEDKVTAFESMRAQFGDPDLDALQQG
ncbi:MAG TPA: HD domain-containing protein [Trebonia sp.]|nr:HD domain-containing protein [Trebonia sp.]